MNDLRKIPPDSDYWKNPPLPKADNHNGGWLSWCQNMAEEKYESVRRGAKNDGPVA